MVTTIRKNIGTEETQEEDNNNTSVSPATPRRNVIRKNIDNLGNPENPDQDTLSKDLSPDSTNEHLTDNDQVPNVELDVEKIMEKLYNGTHSPPPKSTRE